MQIRALYLIPLFLFGCADAGEEEAGVPQAVPAPGEASAPEPGGDEEIRIGAFTLSKQIDPMTDRDESVLLTEALGESQFSWTPSLSWRCDAEDIELIIFAGDFLTSDDPVRVQYRLDERPAEEPSPWSVSTTGQAVFAPASILLELSDGAKDASRLRVRLTDYRGTHHDLEFGLSGLAAGLDSLACGFDVARGILAARREAEEAQYAAAAARRAAAAQREDSLRALRERVVLFWADRPFIGNPNTMAYAPTSKSCWVAVADSSSGRFFKSKEEAEAAGYHPSAVCR